MLVRVTFLIVHLLLTSDREQEKVFGNIPIVGFRRAKILKDILVIVKVAFIEKKKGYFRSCGGTTISDKILWKF